MNVFVSNVTREFERFRDAICEDLRDWRDEDGHERVRVISMDDGPEPIAPIDWSIREAGLSDVLILLIGECHGEFAPEPNPDVAQVGDIDRLRDQILDAEEWKEVVNPKRFSYTQWETLSALASQKPVLAFTPDVREKPTPDLKAYWQKRSQEDENLRDRQRRFRKWLTTKRCKEGFFRDRLDLVRAVQRALRRHADLQGPRSPITAWGRLAKLLGTLLCLLAVVVFLLARHMPSLRSGWSTDQTHAAEPPKSAVTLGCSLAMLGQSSQGSGEFVFETSLKQLDLPQNQVDDLYGRFVELDRAVFEGSMSFEHALSEFKPLVLNKLSLHAGSRSVRYAEFGFRLAYVRLSLQHWEKLQLTSRDAEQVKEYLADLRDSATQVGLPDSLAQEIGELDSSVWQNSDQREAALDVLDRVLRQYPRDST